VVPYARDLAGRGVPGPVQLRRGHRACRPLDRRRPPDRHWLYALIQAFRHRGGDTTSAAAQGLGKLLVSGLALSIDYLAVGFALGTYHVALLTAAVLIGAVSVTMALAGLELGRLLGTKIGERGEALGGIVLVGVGIAIATGLL
jgi:putative Mn2+ efflux pump MntP